MSFRDIIDRLAGKFLSHPKSDKDVTIEKNQNSEIITGGKDGSIHIKTGDNTLIRIEQTATSSKSGNPTLQKPAAESS